MKTLNVIKRRILAVTLCACMVLSGVTSGDTAYTMDDSTTESFEENASSSERADSGSPQDAENGNMPLGGGYNGTEL